jgi:hypothetical protein
MRFVSDSLPYCCLNVHRPWRGRCRCYFKRVAGHIQLEPASDDDGDVGDIATEEDEDEDEEDEVDEMPETNESDGEDEASGAEPGEAD